MGAWPSEREAVVQGPTLAYSYRRSEEEREVKRRREEEKGGQRRIEEDRLQSKEHSQGTQPNRLHKYI